MAVYKRIPENIVAKIKQENDIVSVVEQYVPLQKKGGSNFFGLCPFHNEDTPSFSVSPAKQIFHCFGCNKGGDVVSFIKEIEHMDYPEALRFLAQRVQIEIPEIDDEKYKEEKKQREELQQIMLEAARFYFKQLHSERGGRGLDYLLRRQVAPKTAMAFGLGLAPDHWNMLYHHLKKQAYDDEILLLSGLFKRSERGSIYDLFRQRLIFPIISPLGRGKVLGLGGRVMDDSQPKYINSPESPLFIKGHNLYAIDMAKKSSAPSFLLVEGYLDVISLHQAGFTQAVAPLGTALTAAQAKLMRQYKATVTVCFDADKAGVDAALRSFTILEGAGLEIYVLQIPQGKDPDDFIKMKGASAFQVLLDQALPLLDFRLEAARLASTRASTLDQELYLNKILGILPDIRTASLQEIYLTKAATQLGVSLQSLRRDVEHRRQQGAASAAPQAAERREEHPVRTAFQQQERGGEESGQTAPLPNRPSGRASPGREKKLYTAALRLLDILTEDPALYRQLPQALTLHDLAPLGNKDFVQTVLEALQAGRSTTQDIYGIIENKHNEADRLTADLAAVAAENENIRLQAAGDGIRRDGENQTELLRYFKILRRAALQERKQNVLRKLETLAMDTDEAKAQAWLLTKLEEEIALLRPDHF